MKSLLGLSLALNLALGMMLFFNSRKNSVSIERPMEVLSPREESFSKPKVIETRGHVVSEIPATEKKQKRDESSLSKEDKDFQFSYEVASERMQTEKAKFLSDNLELSTEAMDSVEKIRTEYQKEMAKISEGRGVFLPNLAERKRMILLEELRNERISKILGAKKYESYMKFIEKYNAELGKQHQTDSSVIIPMDL